MKLILILLLVAILQVNARIDLLKKNCKSNEDCGPGHVCIRDFSMFPRGTCIASPGAAGTDSNKVKWCINSSDCQKSEECVGMESCWGNCPRYCRPKKIGEKDCMSSHDYLKMLKWCSEIDGKDKCVKEVNDVFNDHGCLRFIGKSY